MMHSKCEASRPTRSIGFDRLWRLLICIYFVCNKWASAADDSSLPSLWSSVSSGEEKAYHVVYNLEIDGADQMLTVEEWASYEKRLFRLDLIAGAERKSYLLIGATKEIFLYEPFVCNQIDINHKNFDRIKEIFLGYRWDQHGSNSAAAANDDDDQPFMAYGLGPLWLRARQDLIESKLLPYGRYEKRPDREFDGFEVLVKNTGKTSREPDRLKFRFFFAKGKYHFVDTIDWIVSEERILTRAKVLSVDLEAPEVSVFKLPIGHGCKHKDDLDLELQMDVGLVLLHQGQPNQVVFNVIASKPQDDLMQSWTSQRYSMRMTRHSRSRRDDLAVAESYYVTLMQFRSPEDGKLKRIKRVWWAPNGSQGQATVYEIDQETGKCEMGHNEVRDQIVLGYIDDRALAADPNAKPAVLSVDQISYFFADKTDYHMIDEGEPLDRGEFNKRYYEKRIDNFRLTTDGQTTWQGPVSMVKRISSFCQDMFHNEQAAAAQRAKLALWSNYQTTLTIFFYSQDYKRLVYKVVLELLGNHLVSYAYVHKQLDVSTCFKTDDQASQVVSVKYPIENTELLRKLEEREETIRSALFANLFESAISTLPGGTEVTSLGGFLSPLQVANVELSFDLFTAHLKMTVLDVPLTQLFQLNVGYILEAGLANATRDPKSEPLAFRQVPKVLLESALMKTTSASAERCADRCEHYSCLRFSYDSSTRACHIALIDKYVHAVERPGAELYTYYDRLHRSLAVPLTGASHGATLGQEQADRPHLNAASVVEYLESAVLAPPEVVGQTSSPSNLASADSENWPLVLSINLRPHLTFLKDYQKNSESIVTMRPGSIVHDLDTMNEYVRELNAKQDDYSGVVRLLDGGDATRLRLQYRKFLENHRLMSSDIGQKIDGLATYEQCEQFCEINDCRSFHYCGSDESCVVSQLTDSSLAAPLATEQVPLTDQCNIYLLDELSKFEDFGLVPAPREPFTAKYPDLTARSCANVCMNTNDSCQGFYHCRSKAGSPGSVVTQTCYTTRMHTMSLRGTEREKIFEPAGLKAAESHPEDPDSQTPLECTYYSRSYLALFDKYRGKALDISDSESVNYKGGIDASKAHAFVASFTVEQCARLCIQKGCLAFDSCPAKEAAQPGSDVQSAFMREKCALLMNGVQKSHLKPHKRCTTFVLSDKSQFNKRGAKLILDSSTDPGAGHLAPDQEAAISLPDGQPSIVSDLETGDLSGPDLELLQLAADKNRRRSAAEMLHDASHWLARLFSFSLGTICGCLFVVAWNEAYARGWLDRATRGIATRANWR